MKISFVAFHLLETHVQRKWSLDIRHFIYKKEIEVKKKHFLASLTKSKSVAFSHLFVYICYPMSFEIKY